MMIISFATKKSCAYFSILNRHGLNILPTSAKRLNSSDFVLETNTGSESQLALTGKSMFCLNDYDVIGFDLDHTLCKYKLKPVSQLIYKIMCEYLVQHKNYPSSIFESYEASAKFYQKGIVIDTKRGNFMKLGEDFSILRATHGTKPLTNEEIKEIYGFKKIWEPTTNILYDLCENKFEPRSYRSLLDYFVIPAPYICAKIIDYVDTKSEGTFEDYTFWIDVYESIAGMFRRECFKENKGGYFPALRRDLPNYVEKCSIETLEWLKMLKKHKRLFLLTGSHLDYADFLLNYIIGEDWRDYFHVCVTYARKPGFFYMAATDRPFLQLDGFEEKLPVPGMDLKEMNVYSQGNWNEFYTFFSRLCVKNNPKFLYFGDLLTDDVYASKHFSCCDSVAVIEEMAGEGMLGVESFNNAIDELNSKLWGSFFIDSDGGMKKQTLWCSVARKYGRLAIPSLSAMSAVSLTLEIPSFTFDSTLDTNGFFPGLPVVYCSSTASKM